MGRLIRWTVENLLHIDKYERLKPGYFEIYRTGYNLPQVQDRATKSNSQLKVDSINAGTQALQFDPHAAVNAANNTYAAITLILSLIAVVFEALNIAINYAIILPNFEISRWVSLAIGGIPAYVPFLIALYLWLLSRDTELVQEMNDRLRIPPREIIASDRDTERLFVYKIWNSSLSSNKKIPVMSFLVMVRMIRESWYQLIMRMISEHFEELYEADSVREVIRLLYPEVRKEIFG